MKNLEIFECVNIDNYFNNRVVYDPNKRDEIVGIDGDAYIDKTFPKMNAISKTDDNVPIHFAKTEKGDNIIAQNQTIEIKQGTYTKAYFFGFMHWGAKYDYVKFRFSNGCEIKKKVWFYDWNNPADEAIDSGRLIDGFDRVKKICKCVGISKYGLGVKGAVYVYSYDVDLPRNAELIEIILPDNMFMHIFAITLKKV